MENIFVIYDRNVAEFAAGIAPGSPRLGICATEETKTFESAADICRWLMDQGADRDALLLAVGGGVTTDLVGFAAGIYKRGVRYANIPTTLLAMVDAAIGGKTGVNLDSYKNMIGVFRQPEYTEIHIEALKTLPLRDLRSGAAEMLKTFIINNKGGNYEKTVALFSAPEMDWEALEPLVKAAGDIKRGIVERDFTEQGERILLNLGHTYAHAIEWYTRDYTHGEAVAIGIIEATDLARIMCGTPAELEWRLRADFAACGLPTDLPCDRKELWDAIRKDKKAKDGRINIVLPRSIGEVTVKKLRL